MIYRKINQSDLGLLVITFGARTAGSWMWGKTERKDAIEAMTDSCNFTDLIIFAAHS
jgi:hypothetical protein